MAPPLLALLVLGGLAVVLVQGQRTSTAELIERFHVRAEVGARFLSSYVDELADRERAVATATLGAPEVSAREFAATVANLGFSAAVLLDADGRALHVHPPNMGVIGQDLAARYDHLRRAARGEIAISDVVPSAAESVPVVGFAVPFTAETGRRVFSGALSMADTSLGTAYLGNILPLPGARVYLVDGELRTVASSVSPREDVAELAEAEPDLHDAVAARDRGFFDSGRREQFVSVPIDGTRWRLILAVPESSLLLPLQGPQRWLPWALFAGLVAAFGLIALLLTLRARTQAAQMAELERVSITDSLTGLYNRRGFEVLGEQALRAAVRDGVRLVVVFLDVDGLKALNDSHGHAAGNRALVATADVLREVLRDADVVARVGGDEYCVVARTTGTAPDPSRMIERIEAALATRTEGAAQPLRVSGGVSWFDPAAPRTLEELVAEADSRMYLAKQRHRSQR